MIQIINISLIPSDNKPVINVSQFDNISRVLRFNVFDDLGMETPHVFDDGDTVLLNIRKNDNNIVVITGVIVSDIDPDTQEITEQYLTFELTEQACACVGSNFGEVSITSGDDEVIGSCNFKIIVERSPLSGGVSSQTAIDNLTTQIEQITEEVIGDNYYDKEDIDSKFDDLDIPTKTSELENDSGFITSADIPTIPTKTSQLTNDSGFITASALPTKTSQLTNDSGFTTIDDAATANDKTWSSDKITEEIINILPTGNASGSIANFNTALAFPLEIESDFGANVDGVSELNIGYVDMNQLALPIVHGNYGTSYTQTSTLTYNDGVVTSTAIDGVDINTNVPFVQGHKYYVKAKLQASFTSNVVNRLITPSQVISSINLVANTLYIYEKVFSADNNQAKIQFYKSIASGNTLSLSEFIVIDLTAAFGSNIADYLYSLSDNGITIVKQLFTKEYYPYNAGGSIVTLNSVNGEYTCPAEHISLGSIYYNGGKVIIDKNGHRTLSADGQTVVLPDGEPINALVGDNNVYCDTGDTKVKYKDTINNYIDTRVNTVSNRSLSMMRTIANQVADERTIDSIVGVSRTSDDIERGDNNDDNAR